MKPSSICENKSESHISFQKPLPNVSFVCFQALNTLTYIQMLKMFPSRGREAHPSYSSPNKERLQDHMKCLNPTMDCLACGISYTENSEPVR